MPISPTEIPPLIDSNNPNATVRPAADTRRAIIDNVEIIMPGGARGVAASAADHVALALMGAGATVDFPGRPNHAERPGQTLRGVHAVVRMAESAGLAVLPGASEEGVDLPAAAKIAVGVVALLVLCSAEVRLH